MTQLYDTNLAKALAVPLSAFLAASGAGCGFTRRAAQVSYDYSSYINARCHQIRSDPRVAQDPNFIDALIGAYRELDMDKLPAEEKRLKDNYNPDQLDERDIQLFLAMGLDPLNAKHPDVVVHHRIMQEIVHAMMDKNMELNK